MGSKAIRATRTARTIAVAIAIAAGAVAVPHRPGHAAAGLTTGNAPTLETVAAAGEAMRRAGSYRFSGQVTLTAAPAVTVQYDIRGVADRGGARSFGQVTGTDLGDKRLRILREPGGFLVATKGFPAELPAGARGKDWIRFDATPGSIDDLTGPRRAFDFTAQPGLEFRVVGPSTLGGVEVVRVHLEWPLELPPLPGPRGFTIPGVSETQRVDLWIDAEGRVVRELAIVYIPGERNDVASIRTRMDYSGFGEPLKVPVPRPGRTVDAADLGVGSTPVV